MQGLIWTVLLLLLGQACHAEAGLEPDDPLIQHTREIRKKASPEDFREILERKTPEGYEAAARAVADESRRQVLERYGKQAEVGGANAEGSSGEEIRIYVSRSLGEWELRELAKDMAGREGVVILFRGVDKGESLKQFVASLEMILKGIEDPPAIQLDPEKFRQDEVEVVPETVIYRNGKRVASMRGSYAIDWLEREIERGRMGDLGKRGPTREISEVDLIEELKRRLAALDLKAMKELAIRRYWKRAHFVELPVARENRIREIDPTVVAVRDIKDADGKVLIKAGTRANPLEKHPFNRRLIIFDPTDARQTEVARHLLETTDHGMRPVLIASRFDRDKGWEGIRELEKTLSRPVYLLNKQILSRFHLEAVPSIVEARNGRFVVTEVAVR